jgi:uncharacterized phage-associated protein
LHYLIDYFVEQNEKISPWKLHKLLYYTQAWHLVWTEQPAFEEKINAAATGPVINKLLPYHKQSIELVGLPSKDWSDDQVKIDGSLQETAAIIQKEYGSLKGHQLTKISKSERPWKDARQGFDYDDIVGETITNQALLDYYHQLNDDPQAVSLSEIIWA